MTRSQSVQITRLLLLALALLVAASAGRAAAQEDDRASDSRGARWGGRTPPRSPQSTWYSAPWYFSAGAGAAWFGGDDFSDSPAFTAQARVAYELSREVYLVGAYQFFLAETEVEADGALPGDPVDEEDHDLHAVTLGAGARLELTPEVQFFVEPRFGVVFGSDADAAPVAARAGGAEFFVATGISVRFELAGMVTETDIETDAGDAELESILSATIGMSFEF